MINATQHFARVREGRVFGGVAAGIARYFGIDPVIVRLLFIFLFIATGFVPLVVAYAVAVWYVPYGPDDSA